MKHTPNDDSINYVAGACANAVNRKISKEKKLAFDIDRCLPGLKNISNFCLGNSVIQALFPFRDIIKEKPDGMDQLPSETFKLRSVVEHIGIGTTSGHYRAYAKKNGKWLFLNDTTVQS